ncbi:S-layer homology domain-containing protein [uncultured Deinococcus sp.]|uniref:S-layer homology domain-containing protein n=2 Tax=uncultured Deinococcus sp. TaxID=158789 RepID=UPI00258B71F9|nr:S-layer homology domain-containing protein [uncultured Deinococcus sp.]
MKKSLIALTAALSFGLAAAQTAAPASAPQVPALTDVPAGHWAKDAIDRLVSRGIILGYPDGTFRGTQNLTRYEASVIIARVLDQIRSGETPASGLNAEDLTALQNAIQELAADLAALGVRVSDLEENAVNKDDFARLEARIEEVATAQGDATALANIQAQIDELTSRADDYDTLRADVDDNASSIAALNDLTVLLNQDILDLQDRVSAVEAAQADFVQRSDFNNLAGRVGVVETRVETVNNSLTGRIAALERNAFSVKPSLTLGYSVSRANRNFDIDRLFPLNADGTVANNAFTSGGIDSDTGAQRRDFGDFGNATDVVVANRAGLYGFAATDQFITVYYTDGTTQTINSTTYNNGAFTVPTGKVVDTTKGTNGFGIGRLSRYQEGETTIGISLGFNTSGQFGQVASATGGSLFSTGGRLSVNTIDLNFGLVTTLPSDSYIDTNGNGTQDAGEVAGRTQYPGSGGSATVLRDSAGNIYRPVFFQFKNATTQFSVGNNPVIVTLGRQQKFYFSDYLFDNDYDGRGDGFTVTVDGSNVPVIGAFKPVIKGVYGSNSGLDGTGEAGYGAYYRGIRAQITPVGTLTAGLNYAEEGLDQFGAAANTSKPADVTAYGADLHGKAFGVELHSEYEVSRVTPKGGATTSTSAFYARAATRKTNLAYDLNTPAARIGTDAFNVSVYDLNYRNIDAKYTNVSGISESGYGSYSQTSAQNVAYNPDNGVTAPFANLSQRDYTYQQNADGTFVLVNGKRVVARNADDTVITANSAIGQRGFGTKLAATLGPVSVGGYYDNSTGSNGSDATRMIERGASAKVAASIFSLRGSYNELLSNRNQVYRDASGTQIVNSAYVRRYAVQADVTPGLGLSVGAYYRDVNVNGVRSTTDRGLLGRGYLASSFAPGVGANTYRAGLSCADNNFGTGTSDIDGVGGVLNPAVNLDQSRTSTCFTSYGVELGHAGDNANALVKDLFFRVGYSRVYVPSSTNASTGNFDGSVTYGDVRFDRKLGAANVRLAGAFSNSSTALDSRPAGTRGSVGLIVRTDPLTGLPFSPQLNGQVGYYTADNGNAAATNGKYQANAVKYGAGIVLNDFLLPNTKIGVRYDGYTAQNRQYTPYVASSVTQGYFSDVYDASNPNFRTNLNGVYVEGAYNDLVFSYGNYTLSQKTQNGVEEGSGLNNGQPARGQTFKITYKVNF